MRLSGKTARMTLLIILFMFVCSGLFASSLIDIDSRSFKLVHTVSEDSRFVFTFMNTNVQSPTELNSVEFQSAGTYRFARFQISISTPRPITFTSIELAFSELEHNTVNNAFYDYSLQVYEPFTETETGTVTPIDDGHGACTV